MLQEGRIRVRNRIKVLFKIENIKWFVLAILLLIPFISFCYGDTKSIIHFQVNFADALLSGRIGEFYDICYERAFLYNEMNVGGAHFATYDIVMHALLGIWGIPLYLWCARNGVTEVLYNTYCILYGKAIYIPALIVSAYLIYKICRELQMDKERCEWASYLFCSSLLVFMNVCIIGQSDILAIPLILAGILYYIRDDNKRFVIFFMIAVAFKMFAFFIFVPLLLLKEKHIIRIIGTVVFVYSLSFLANLPYAIKNTQAIQEKASFNRGMFLLLTERNVPMVDGNVSILVLAIGLLCVYCYLKPLDKEAREYNFIIYIALLSMSIVFLSFSSCPYWYIHLAPYLAIVTVYYYDRWNSIMLFETFGILVLTLKHYVQYTWCYDLENVDNMVIQKVFGNVKEYSITLEQIVLEYEMYQSVLNAAFVVGILAVIWLSRPRKTNSTSCNKMMLSRYVYVRLLINVVVAYIPIGVYLVNVMSF